MSFQRACARTHAAGLAARKRGHAGAQTPAHRFPQRTVCAGFVRGSSPCAWVPAPRHRRRRVLCHVCGVAAQPNIRGAHAWWVAGRCEGGCSRQSGANTHPLGRGRCPPSHRAGMRRPAGRPDSVGKGVFSCMHAHARTPLAWLRESAGTQARKRRRIDSHNAPSAPALCAGAARVRGYLRRGTDGGGFCATCVGWRHNLTYGVRTRGGLREDVRVGIPGNQVLTPTRSGVALDPPSSRAGMRRPAGRSDGQMWECECVIFDAHHQKCRGRNLKGSMSFNFRCIRFLVDQKPTV